jgi:NADH:ubiquinone oxidoreductase 20 kD subunit and related Fe-S oxidoreductases
MKQPKIRSMKYEEFKNNDYLESMVKELQDNGVNVVVSKLDDLINWGRSNSVWSFLLGTSCCAIEFMTLGAARYDMARIGFEVNA